jgi:hypothetical protein
MVILVRPNDSGISVKALAGDERSEPVAMIRVRGDQLLGELRETREGAVNLSSDRLIRSMRTSDAHHRNCGHQAG